MFRLLITLGGVGDLYLWELAVPRCPTRTHFHLAMNISVRFMRHQYRSEVRSKSSRSKTLRSKVSRSRLSLQRLEDRNLLAGDVCHNFVEPADVNMDSYVSPLDAMLIINQVARNSISRDDAVVSVSTTRLLDVDDNGMLSANDALQVVDALGQEVKGNDHLIERLPELATLILTEDLPGGMKSHTAISWFDRIHEKLGTPVEERAPFDHLDQNHDGELTPDELDESHWKRISLADADGTGVVTKEEVRAARPSERMLAIMPEKWHAHFETLDSDLDGVITAREVTQGLWDRIADADFNHDSRVSFSELGELRLTQDPEVVVCDAPALDRVFSQFDENGDGRIVQNEVGDFFWGWIGQADANNDNAVSIMEVESALDALGPTNFDTLVEAGSGRIEEILDSLGGDLSEATQFLEVAEQLQQRLGKTDILDDVFAAFMNEDDSHAIIAGGLDHFATTQTFSNRLGMLVELFGKDN